MSANDNLPLFPDLDEDDSDALRSLTAFPRQSDNPPSTLRRMWMRNLKGFESLDIEFTDFNVLVGPNNCGKSTVLQAIDLSFRLLALHAEFRAGALARPRQGRRLHEAMLPVAVPEDFWFKGLTRSGNDRVPVVLGIEFRSQAQFQFEIRSLWGGLNSRMTNLPEGTEEATIKAILARRPTLIPYSVGVVNQEEYRAPARLELLSATGHRNEVLRNFLRELSIKKPAAYEELQHELSRHFGASVGTIDFALDRDQYINLAYEDGDAKHDIFSAGGGFLQLLQLLTYLYLESPGIVLLDEPDAHLHSSMQRLIVDLLANLNRHQRIQVVMATHSKEIINYVEASHILPMSRGESIAKSLERHASVLPVLQEMGAIDNVDLASLVGSKRCVFVEGPSDRKILARFAARIGSTVFEGKTQVVPIVTGGVDNPEKIINLGILEQFIGHRIATLIVRDRDGLPDELVQEINNYASTQSKPVHVLGRANMENFLLVPAAIHRIVSEELLARGTSQSDVPSCADVEHEIELAVDSLKDETLDNSAAHIEQHHAAYRGKHIDVKAANEAARANLLDKWGTFDGKLSVVDGKSALKAIRRRIQTKWAVSFTDVKLIEAIAIEEIPAEIAQIVQLLTDL